ncbi:FAD/NAD(P)-binding domain-containing protein [Roridomyces roridus]|uniref:FAD/NAD(P)-binding domain-containing protein n=1 Tax=Roridomyces roridus TaxID=1738132 RepID=A0AAD7C3S6_9AGAR|nr:FAD/NAD(P)-binding domain-containing protein [Roridomyces roridus]
MTDSLPSSIEVCIVGAGPSGLACALGLAARNIPFVIVDAVAEGHTDSRAIAFNPSALESLALVNPQVADDLVAAGNRGKTFSIVDRKDNTLFSLPLSNSLSKYTKFHWVLVMPQHIAEEQMRNALKRAGHPVYFNNRVHAAVDGGSQYTLQFESGHVLQARYVVAADGSKSFLRSFAGISSIDPLTNKLSAPGPTDESFIVADVILSNHSPFIPRDGMQIRLGDDGFVLTGPMIDPSLSAEETERLFRLYIGMSDVPPRNPDIEYLQRILDTRGPGAWKAPKDVPKIAKVLSSQRFRTRNSLAETYVRRSSTGGAYILLAGDAAHTHGPAGGQGMNLGISEACELAEAIYEHRNASLAEKKDSEKILDTFSTRRRAVAREIILMVEGMSVVERGGTGWMLWMRTTMMWLGVRIPGVKGYLAWNLSGLGRIQKRASL